MNKDLEQLIIEFCYKVVSADQEQKRDEKKPLSKTTTYPFNNNHINTVDEVFTNKITSCKTVCSDDGYDMTWINVREPGSSTPIGKCLKHCKPSYYFNKECLINLKLVNSDEDLSIDDIEIIASGSEDDLVGKTIKYTKTDDGKYIKNILGVVD